MPKINLLDKSVYELIAAGEVIERPSSVIKELAENSIDAGAASITVEIKRGGISYLRVTDDGCGISHEDIPTAFMRHATSKVYTQDDLDSINTLGFRGEALASVCAVSRVELLTKQREDQLGSIYRIEAGEPVEYDRAGCADGTTIIIRDLFYNTPARLKFLKKDVTEGNYCASVIEKLALSHPGISFRFIRDGRQTMLSSGDGEYYSAVYAVFGKQFAAGLIPVENVYQNTAVTGYVSSPLFTRANRSMQNFFVNGRSVKSPLCCAALEEAFRNTIMVGKFPSCVLCVNTDPSQVDANIHPTKTEVRFTNEKIVFDAVYFAVKNALMGYDESREMYWANPETGCSANFWLRAMGWFLVAMVDVLERMDEQMYYEYRAIMAMFKEAVEAMIQFQDAETGMFWQVIDKAGVPGNYLETSGSSLFAYAVLKGVRLGYLPKRFRAYGEKAFYGTCDKYLGVNDKGELQLSGICLVAGLGGATRRDGSLEYYFSEPVVENDAKGVAPLLLAYTEMIIQ